MDLLFLPLPLELVRLSKPSPSKKLETLIDFVIFSRGVAGPDMLLRLGILGKSSAARGEEKL